MKLTWKGLAIAVAVALAQGPAQAAGAAAKTPAPSTAAAAPHAPEAPRDAPAAAAAGPGFSCTGDLSVVEALICASAELSELDRAMAQAYSASVQGLVGSQRSRAVDAQRRWLTLRNGCRDETCLASAYRTRMAALGTGAPARQAIRPSFDCRPGLGKAEAAICSDGGLAELDLRLAAAYSLLAGSLDAEARQRLAVTQRRWLGRRDGCGADHACLATAYAERLAAIRGWSEAAQE